MGTATLQRPPATVTQLGFTWSCAGECDAKGHDRAEYMTHMRGHGQRAMSGTKLIRLPKTAPAATLRKLPLDDPCAVIEWDDMRRDPGVCECGHGPDVHGPDWVTDTEGTWEWHGTGRRRRQRYVQPVGHMTDPGCTECACAIADHEIDPVITEVHRSGQFWGVGPSSGTVWVLPHKPAPWDDGQLRPVMLRTGDDGYSMCRADPGNAVRQAENVRQRGVFAIITDHYGGPARTPAKTVHTDTECATADGWRESDHRPHGMWRVVDTLAGRAEAEPGVTLCPRCVLLEPSEDAPQAIESSTGRDSADPVTEPAQPHEPSVAAEVPSEQAKHDITEDEMGETMDTEQAPAPAPEADRFEDADAWRAKSRARRAAIAKTAADAGIRPATGTVAIPERKSPALISPPIDGARVLNQAYGFLGHMAYWPSDAAQIAATLYAGVAHGRDDKTKLPVFPYMPRLFFTSEEGGSGKSRMARITAALCPDPERLAEMTKASLIDLIAARHTVIITEFDTLVGATGKRTPWLAGLVNVGYEDDGKTSRKQGGVPIKIYLCGPLIGDGLKTVFESSGDVFKTMKSRCLLVEVFRAPEGYRAVKYRREAKATAEAIRGRLARWMAQEVRDDIGERDPVLPQHLGNRPADLWEPLMAVAEAAGEQWPELARFACERIETAAGRPGEEEVIADQVDATLDSWGAQGPVVPVMVPADDMDGDEFE